MIYETFPSNCYLAMHVFYSNVISYGIRTNSSKFNILYVVLKCKKFWYQNNKEHIKKVSSNAQKVQTPI